MAACSSRWQDGGRRIALVPTMGFLHEGHLALVRAARQKARSVVVSIFVNPIQFGPGEDLERYPRDLKRDCRLLEQEGVDVLFHPTVEAMYPAGFQTSVRVSRISQGLCGASRPGHFDGVTTVVAKLFGIIRPQVAIFGEKDLQQLAVIRRMVADLHMGVEIVGHPIVREADGLARSSRNVYLRPGEREAALSLSRGIALWRREIARGESRAANLQETVRAFILTHPGTAIDYIAQVDRESLEPVDTVDGSTVLALAVRIHERVRLIDNSGITAQVEETVCSA